MECFLKDQFALNLMTASLNILQMVEVICKYDDNQILEDYINVLLLKSLCVCIYIMQAIRTI